MSNQNHPWIQDFASFEAVLCCTHKLGQWEPSSTLRAYQTYGFDDASTPGNDQTFRHIDTGVLLLHDGEVVAIQFGDGNLSAALSDLFLVLNALGWKEAEVYHPSETLPALLHDMGKAIPGHMEFDVKGAKGASDSGRLAEAAALIERGKSLVQGVASGAQEVQDFNQLALGELESMAPDHHALHSAAVTDASAPQPTHQSAEVVPASAPVYLVEDFDIELRDATPGQSFFAQEPAPGVRPQHGQVFLDDDDSGPVVPVLGAPAQQSPAHSSESASLEANAAQELPVAPTFALGSHTSPETEALEERGHREVLVEVPVVQLAQPAQAEPSLPPNAPTGVAEGGLLKRRSARDHGGMQSLIRIGNSALSFDLPDAPMSMEHIGQCADQLSAVEVVHLWPGLINQAERWDLIGELDLTAPWFAEVVASEVVPHETIERVWFAAALLQLARQRPRSQLRDLLTMMLAGDANDCGAIVQAATYKPEARERFVSMVLDSFSGLLLSQEGESFIDIRPAECTVADGHLELRAFTVRSMVEMEDPKLYVIHLDAIDGPFIAMIVKLLKAVAERYSLSTRARTRAEALQREVDRRETTQREAERMKTLESVQTTMADLMAQLKKAGLTLPT